MLCASNLITTTSKLAVAEKMEGKSYSATLPFLTMPFRFDYKDQACEYSAQIEEAINNGEDFMDEINRIGKKTPNNNLDINECSRLLGMHDWSGHVFPLLHICGVPQHCR